MTTRTHVLLLVVLSLAVAPAASAQDPLPELSLEDLMQLDSGRVFGASLRTQPVTEAPSSVSFVTAEEIARYGYRSLAEILNGVRGLYVTNDRNFSFLGARGFGKPGAYNSRILLLVNGHRVNDNVFGQAEIGPEFGLDPALFERVEIIRGPGSALYGDSAVFAVVNVITKAGEALGPAAVAADAGSLGTRMLRGTAGRRFSHDVRVALAGTYEASDGVGRLYFPAFDSPATNNGIASGLDGERVAQFYTQVSVGHFTFTGAYGSRRRDVPTASFGTLFNEQQSHEETTDRHTLADLEYTRPIVDKGHVTLRASYDRFSYDGTYPFAGADQNAPALVGRNSVVGARWSLAGRVTRTLPARQVLTVGAEFIDNIQQEQDFGYINPTIPVLAVSRSSTQRAFYLDDQLKLRPWLIFNGGVRYDRYARFDPLTPRVGVIVAPSPTQSFKYLYGRAFRAPNEYEQDSYYFGDTVAGLQPETIDTHELVWERYPADWVRTSVSGYWYDAHRLITLVPAVGTFLETTYVNSGHVRARGLEFETQMRLSHGVESIASYTLQRARDTETDMALANSPAQMGKLRVSVRALPRASSLALEVLVLGSRRSLAGATLPTVVTANLTAIVPLTRTLNLTGSLRNLFDESYADPASDAHREDLVPQNGRTLRIGVRVKLPSH
ncbi:MAG: TonB-dependent receptor [Acidobacteriota bacterium]